MRIQTTIPSAYEIQRKIQKTLKDRKARKWNVEALKGSMRKEYEELVENSIWEIENTQTVEGGWDNVKTRIVKAAERSIGYVGSWRIKKPWITEEMINEMEERRKWKNIDTEQGKRMYVYK